MGAGLDTVILCQILPQHTENNYELKSLCECQLIPWDLLFNTAVTSGWLTTQIWKHSMQVTKKEEFNALMKVTVICVSLAVRAYD